MSSSGVRATFFALFLAVLVLAGCANVEVVDLSVPALDSVPVPEPKAAEQHDLAVLAVDFDPPLKYEEIVACRSRGEGITLLVAVENTGLSTERNASVQARLSERLSETVYVEKLGTIDVISPGEIKIVQLRDTDIPFSFEYTLSVSVVPVEGELQVDDNSKTYDLLISQP